MSRFYYCVSDAAKHILLQFDYLADLIQIKVKFTLLQHIQQQKY